MQMKKLILVGGLMTLLGCSDAASPRDLAIAVTPGRSLVKPGDTLTVTVTAMNIGSRALTITSSGCPRPFQVFGPENQPVMPTDICSAVAVRYRLEPGDSQTFQYVWGTPLSPGSYLLRGAITADEFGPVEAGSAQIYIGP